MATIVIKDSGILRKLSSSAIFYIQSHPQKPHVVEIVTGKERYELRTSLTELAEAHSDSLIRCNRQTLVNLSKVKGFDRKSKSLTFDQEGLPDLTCSRRHFASLVKRWIQEGGN